jgi:alpha/beta hydrolase fold
MGLCIWRRPIRVQPSQDRAHGSSIPTIAFIVWPMSSRATPSATTRSRRSSGIDEVADDRFRVRVERRRRDGGLRAFGEERVPCRGSWECRFGIGTGSLALRHCDVSAPLRVGRRRCCVARHAGQARPSRRHRADSVSLVDVPETRYARSGDLQIAYQIVGEGPLDVVLVPPYLSNIEMYWDLPFYSRFFGRLSSFSRLILFDRRGSGMSDGIAGATPLEEQIDDVQAVIDAVGSEPPALFSFAEGCGLTALFAASHPHLVRALVLVSPQPPAGGRTGVRVGAEC